MSQLCENGGVYDLYGVINHTGSLQFGHYYAYAYNKDYDEWFEYNDSSVSSVTESQVVTSCAYVLFYKLRGFECNTEYDYSKIRKAPDPNFKLDLKPESAPNKPDDDDVEMEDMQSPEF